MNGWFASHAGIFELVLVEGIVLGLAFYELRSIRRTLRKDRSAAPAPDSGPGAVASHDPSATAPGGKHPPVSATAPAAGPDGLPKA